jgi:hypothetical protein
MKKVLLPALLLLFVSFQTFQLWDETGDTVETVLNSSHVITQKSAEWKAAAAPYDDADASFPLVVGQSLTHGSNLGMDATEYPVTHFLIHPALTVLAKAFINDRSPPPKRISAISFAIASFILDRSPARGLAPPLV